MTELAPITNHVAHGLARLLEQYKGRPRMEALVESYLAEVQELSDAIWSCIVGRLLDNAIGEQLNVLGRIVGQERQGATDDRFRVVLRARIGINRSSGQADEMIDIATIILDGIAFSFEEYFPATILIDIPEECDFADLFFGMMTEAKAAGVALTVHWFDGHEEADSLLWSAGDEFEDDTSRGFGGDDPDAGDGGFFIGAF